MMFVLVILLLMLAWQKLHGNKKDRLHMHGKSFLSLQGSFSADGNTILIQGCYNFK